MKKLDVENIVVDEVHQRTFVVMAQRVMTDGEIFRAIRVELMKRGGKHMEKGEKMVISSSVN
jgi:hypothetical protein